MAIIITHTRTISTLLVALLNHGYSTSYELRVHVYVLELTCDKLSSGNGSLVGGAFTNENSTTLYYYTNVTRGRNNIKRQTLKLQILSRLCASRARTCTGTCTLWHV